MSRQERGNLILFPKTVDYYQIQLTRLLETEKYREAIELLAYLMQFTQEDPRTLEEWRRLHDWLQTMCPPEGDAHQAQEEEWTESDMLRSRVAEKARSDEGYADRLMEMLNEPGSADRQLLALDQLAYIDTPKVRNAVRSWLEDKELGPLVQFKALQALRRLGETGAIRLNRLGEPVAVDIESTPLTSEDYPSVFHEIIRLLQEKTEIHQPSLSYFAGEVWYEFLGMIYGASMYHLILAEDEGGRDIWASALYSVIGEAVEGRSDPDEAKELFGVTGDMAARWNQVRRSLQAFFGAAWKGK